MTNRLLAHGLVVSDFWLDDVTGALVAMVRPANSGNFPLQFWRSNDQGATWTMIADQQADLGVASGGFARPTGSWSLCAITPVDISAPLTVLCTADGGQTWNRFHRTTPMMSPGDLSDELRALVWQVVFKRDDGRFIIAVMDSERAMTLLLLDPVSGTWTALGQTATALLRYAPNARWRRGHPLGDSLWRQARLLADEPPNRDGLSRLTLSPINLGREWRSRYHWQ